MSTSNQNRPNPLLVANENTVEHTVEDTSSTQPTPVPTRIVAPEKPRFVPHLRNAKRGAPMLRALRPRRRG